MSHAHLVENGPLMVFCYQKNWTNDANCNIFTGRMKLIMFGFPWLTTGDRRRPILYYEVGNGCWRHVLEPPTERLL